MVPPGSEAITTSLRRGKCGGDTLLDLRWEGTFGHRRMGLLFLSMSPASSTSGMPSTLHAAGKVVYVTNRSRPPPQKRALRVFCPYTGAYAVLPAHTCVRQHQCTKARGTPIRTPEYSFVCGSTNFSGIASSAAPSTSLFDSEPQVHSQRARLSNTGQVHYSHIYELLLSYHPDPDRAKSQLRGQ